jgi:hypothetical protein
MGGCDGLTAIVVAKEGAEDGDWEHPHTRLVQSVDSKDAGFVAM